MNKVSAVIICKNEEKNIAGCLQSISWCDEIVIIDGYSTDNTFNIAKLYSDKVLQNEWKSFADQREFALTKAKYEWIFSLDADERCTKELENEIKSLLQNESLTQSGFEIPRKSFFLNRWIRHGGWYPNFQLRLFKKTAARVSERLVHESYVVNGHTARIKNDILHYTVTSISEYVNKINLYSTLSAREKSLKRKVNFIDIHFYPIFAFFHQYILKGNLLDGMGGLMVSKFHMITKLLNNIKIWELQNKNK